MPSPILRVIALAALFLHICTATQWVVYPERSLDVNRCAQTTRFLTDILGKPNVQQYGSTIRKTTEFWLVQAGDAQKARVSQLPNVKAVYKNSVVVKDCGQTYGDATGLNSSTKPEAAVPNSPFRWQADAPPDLAILSWPPKKVLPDKFRGYVYDIIAGVDTYIYVIDNGINIQNSDFTRMPWPPTPEEWHYAPGVRQTQTDDSEGHGSCVASKAAGWRKGVSKNSRLVIMKSSLTVADQHWAFAATLDDILQKGRQKKAVIVYPRASIRTANDDNREGPQFMWDVIQNLIYELSHNAGILTVVAAGNAAGRSQKIDAYPAIWADSKPAVDNKPLLAVGAVTLQGSKFKLSQGMNEFQLRWAPGEGISCAGEPWGPESVLADGTSFAAAMVAGLAAYTMSQRSWADPTDLVSMLRTRKLYHVYPVKTNPDVVWNGLNGAAKGIQSSSGRLLSLLNLTASE